MARGTDGRLRPARRARTGRVLAVGMAAASLVVGVGSVSAILLAGVRARSSGSVHVEGIVGVVHADPVDGRSRPYLETFLTSERDPSQVMSVTFAPVVAARHGGVEALVDKRVAVTAVPETRRRERGTLTAVAVDVRGDASKGVTLGLPPGTTAVPKPTLTVLCKFENNSPTSRA